MVDNVVDIGEMRIARDRVSQFLPKACQHKSLRLEEHGEVVKCVDCGTQVSAFWALKMMTEQWATASSRLKAAREALEADKQANLHLVAARKVEKAWRNKTMVPACPHCHRGVFASDGFGGAMVNKRIEEANRNAESQNRTTEGEKK